MKNFALFYKRTTLVQRLGLVISVALLVAGIMAPKASMQEAGSPSTQMAAAIDARSSRPVEDSKPGGESVEAQGPLAVETVTGVSYPFTSAAGIALEDMSTGTTQLVAAAQDDTASAVTNIGFDFWFDGVRQTQFSVNANGLFGLGGVAVNNGASGRTNDFATATNNPKMAAYWDDMCTGATGKVHFKIIGSAPNRKLVVEWLNLVQFDNVIVACSPTIRGTAQLWLFEGTGVIQMVNGGTSVNDNGNGGYGVGIGSGTASFGSVTTTGPTVSYAASSNANLAAIAAGTQYTFTPNVPLAPSGPSVSPITPTSLTLNWTDNATNEVGYVIYRSTDNVTFNFLTQIAANSTSFLDSGLNPGTQYFYRVNAVTEGALSTTLSLSATTTPAGEISCQGAGGNWDSVGTWSGGIIPSASDNITIGSGCTVTVNVTNATALNVTINSGGVLQSPTSGAVTNNNLTAGGNVTNNGTLDFSTNADTSGAILTFGAGVLNVSLSGTGATTDIRAITVAKGAQATVVDVTSTNFSVLGVTTDVAGFLTLTSGTFKISGTFTGTNRVFTAAAYTIPAAGGIWLNNPNYTIAGQAGSPTTNGLFRNSLGTFNVGNASGNAMGAGAGAVFTIEGGTVNFSGRLLTANAVTYTQSGGNVNVCTVGNAASVTQSFGLTSATTVFNMSGGAITLVQINSTATAANRRDYAVAGTANITGGTLNVGTGATTGNAGNFDFRIQGQVPALTIDNTTNAKNVILTAQTNTQGNVTIPTGSTLNTQSFVWLVIGPTVTNNGTITLATNLSRFYFLGNGPQTYTGTGTCTIVTASGSVDLTMDNPAGLTIDPASTGIVTQRVNFFRGGITNANKLTLGNGGTTVGVIQFGLAGGLNTAGNFDVPPVFNIGSNGQTVLYAQEPTPRTMGNEISPSRSLVNSTINNTNGVIIGGGDLTIALTGTAVSSTLTLTVGNITTNANTLIIASTATVARTVGHVIGNLRKGYAAAGTKTFEVGTANAFSPASLNLTAGTFPATMTVAAVQGAQPVLNPTTSLQRYWSVTEGGDVTANMTFTYATDALDVQGTEAAYRVIRVSGGTPVNFPEVCPAGPCVDEATNTITVAGITNFSDWTAGQPASPTAAPATISGKVTTTSGAPLAGVPLFLSGARTARAITDAAGNYAFANVDTDNFYTVTPGIVNYHFSPASRSFSLLANKTDAVFTAERDPIGGTANAIDTPEYFVRQHYLDFLGREPDSAGLNFWSEQIAMCGSDYNCIERRTINVSAAYFLSIEFQKTGGLVNSLYEASYGRAPRYAEFVPDTAKVSRNVIVGQAGWEALLATNKQEFLDAWVERAEFQAAYGNLTNDGYVDALVANTGVEFTAAERATLVGGLNDSSLTRAGALERVAENEGFVKAKFNEAFVRMQYFGYLRRDPDDSGLHFWLNKLNEFEGNFERAEMVKAFLVSGEYRDRFRP
jgi:hypothetical protein